MLVVVVVVVVVVYAIRNLPHLGKVRIYKQNLSPQNCGFAIYGTYLLTTHLDLFMKQISRYNFRMKTNLG